MLFPIVRKLDVQADGDTPASDHDATGNPIIELEHEHDDAGQALAKMSALTDGFIIPPDACNTYTAMLQAMAALEQDMHRHIHKENNVLFPRAAKREAELASLAKSN